MSALGRDVYLFNKLQLLHEESYLKRRGRSPCYPALPSGRCRSN